MTRHAKNTVEALLTLIILCTVLVGCPPRKPEPMVARDGQVDRQTTQDPNQRR